MNNLVGKRILFLDGLNNLYHNGIIDALNLLGASVTPLIYKDFENRTLLNLIKRKFLKISNVDEDKILSKLDGDFDIVFTKNPEKVSKAFFIKLKEMYPHSKLINYNWNSISHVNYSEYISLFDKVYTFDPVDADKFKLQYFPLFYLPEFEKIGINNNPKEFTISFIGSAFTPGRESFLSTLTNFVKSTNTSAFFYFHAFPYQYYCKTIFKTFNFKNKLYKRYFSHKELIEVYTKSCAFIDHPMSIQKGHTIRTFETLASGLMLITTNRTLQQEPFYDSNRIKIISEDLSDLNIEEIKEYKPSFPEGFERYRIDNWLLQILS